MKLNYKRTILLGLDFMSISSFWQLYDNIIPLILQKSFGLGETLTGTIMALDNVLALFLLPLFGAFSDKVNTRLGKRTPFIILGTVVSVVFMMVIPYADRTRSFPLFFVSLGGVLLAMGTYRSPAVALMPDLTPKPLRSKANAVVNLMGAVGGIYTLAMISFLIPRVANPSYTTIFWAVAILMVVSVALLVFTIRENKLAKEIAIDDKPSSGELQESDEKLPREVMRSLIFLLTSVFLWFMGYNAVTTAFSRYAERVWDIQGGGFANALMVATGAAIVAFIPIGLISSKVGRKKTIMAGILLLIISYSLGALFKDYSPLINLVFGLTGFGWAAINVNSYPMVVEISRSGDLGKYTGYYYTFSMAAQIFTPILSGFLLEKVSYRILFPYAVFFSLASLLTMTLVKHGDSKPPTKASVLENFDVDD